MGHHDGAQQGAGRLHRRAGDRALQAEHLPLLSEQGRFPLKGVRSSCCVLFVQAALKFAGYFFEAPWPSPRDSSAQAVPTEQDAAVAEPRRGLTDPLPALIFLYRGIPPLKW